MTTEEKYRILLKIQLQLLEFASCQPTWHHKLHGGKELNETMQLAKKMITQTEYELSLEEAERLELYFAGGSIALHNIE